MYNEFIRLANRLEKSQKIILGLIIVLGIFVSFVDLASVFLISNLISLISNGTLAVDISKVPIIGGIESSINPLYFVIFIVIWILIAALLRFTFLLASSYFSSSTGHKIAYSIYQTFLKQDYLTITQSTSKITELVLSSTSRSISVLNSFITASSSAFLVSGIIISILCLHLTASIVIVGSLFGSYLIIYRVSRSRLYRYGNQELILNRQSLSLIRESVDSAKELIIYELTQAMTKTLAKVDKKYRNNQAKTIFLSGIPRIFIEMIFMLIIIATFMVMYSKSGKIDFALLSFFAFSLLRLLPSLQTVYASIANIRSYLSSLQAVNSFLDETILFVPRHDLLEENQKITIPMKALNKERVSLRLDNISFSYSSSTIKIFDDLSICVNLGQATAIVGPTGMGKSTLMDLLMAVVRPDRGGLYYGDQLINNENTHLYHRNIAHLPQTPVILNKSIMDNIVLFNKFDSTLLKYCIEGACLVDLVETYGLDHMCGERGSCLSGGQRQRIGIARCLYSNRSVLFLDEATSSLDSATEIKVLSHLHQSTNTIVSITHSRDNLDLYDNIIDVQDYKYQ